MLRGHLVTIGDNLARFPARVDPRCAVRENERTCILEEMMRCSQTVGNTSSQRRTGGRRERWMKIEAEVYAVAFEERTFRYSFVIEAAKDGIGYGTGIIHDTERIGQCVYLVCYQPGAHSLSETRPNGGDGIT